MLRLAGAALVGVAGFVGVQAWQAAQEAERADHAELLAELPAAESERAQFERATIAAAEQAAEVLRLSSTPGRPRDPGRRRRERYGRRRAEGVARRLRLQQRVALAQRVVAYAHLLRISLALADERCQTSIDVSVVNTATVVLHLESPKPPVITPTQTPLRARRKITWLTRPDTPGAVTIMRGLGYLEKLVQGCKLQSDPDLMVGHPGSHRLLTSLTSSPIIGR